MPDKTAPEVIPLRGAKWGHGWNYSLGHIMRLENLRDRNTLASLILHDDHPNAAGIELFMAENSLEMRHLVLAEIIDRKAPGSTDLHHNLYGGLFGSYRTFNSGHGHHGDYEWSLISEADYQVLHDRISTIDPDSAEYATLYRRGFKAAHGIVPDDVYKSGYAHIHVLRGMLPDPILTLEAKYHQVETEDTPIGDLKWDHYCFKDEPRGFTENDLKAGMKVLRRPTETTDATELAKPALLITNHDATRKIRMTQIPETGSNIIHTFAPTGDLSPAVCTLEALSKYDHVFEVVEPEPEDETETDDA